MMPSSRNHLQLPDRFRFWDSIPSSDQMIRLSIKIESKKRDSIATTESDRFCYWVWKYESMCKWRSYLNSFCCCWIHLRATMKRGCKCRSILIDCDYQVEWIKSWKNPRYPDQRGGSGDLEGSSRIPPLQLERKEGTRVSKNPVKTCTDSWSIRSAISSRSPDEFQWLSINPEESWKDLKELWRRDIRENVCGGLQKDHKKNPRWTGNRKALKGSFLFTMEQAKESPKKNPKRIWSGAVNSSGRKWQPLPL